MTSVLFTYLPDAGKLNWGGRDRRVLGALHHAPPGFPRVFDAREISLDLVWRNATIHGSPENILILWYIGDGWEYELRLYFYKG